jgi:glucose/mannose-6-phosphate isomerase
MNLDDLNSFEMLDRQHLLQQIEALPAQLVEGWKLGHQLDLPGWQNIRRVVMVGMGGSAMAGDLLSAYAASSALAPVWVHQDYGLPAWAQGDGTLVVACSNSGETEETLHSFSSALQRKCRGLALTSGGELAQLAARGGAGLWNTPVASPPSLGAGLAFGMLAALFARLGLCPFSEQQIEGAQAAMLKQQELIRAQSPAAQNPAKRLAGQFVERQVIIFGSGFLAPVARRWKTQINEIAKAWAQVEYLPEADHNILAGVTNPEALFARAMMLFLRSSHDLPQNRRRHDLTRQAMMLEGLNTDFLEASGETALEQLWTCLHFGDYVACYLAMAYGVDPGPSAWIEGFKQEMRNGR